MHEMDKQLLDGSLDSQPSEYRMQAKNLSEAQKKRNEKIRLTQEKNSVIQEIRLQRQRQTEIQEFRNTLLMGIMQTQQLITAIFAR